MYMVIINSIFLLLLGLLVVFSCALLRSLDRFRIKKRYTAALTAPSVSVCIPARNETHAMTECLERVLASDYKKLEVLVYDDSSDDNTSTLIRAFAHEGVRFVAGDTPPDGWLGKDYALEVLAREASGTYIAFMDVDTSIEPTTISQLVGFLMTEDLVMMSVIPGRRSSWRSSVLFGHLRYFWQLLLSRSTAPAAASSLWLIQRHMLIHTFDGFSSYRLSVQPESRIAAVIGTKAYHCLVSDEKLGVNYEKKWRSQVETSHRLLYPMMGGSLVSASVGLIVLGLLNVPLILVLSGFLIGWTTLQLVAGCLLVGFGAVYTTYTNAVWRQSWLFGIVMWPIVVAQEFVLAIGSVWKYQHHNVTWKGRLVTPHTDVQSL